VAGASKEVLQDTTNSACKTAKGQGATGKKRWWDLCVKGGIILGGTGKSCKTHAKRLRFRDSMRTRRQNCRALSH
jgi:hypothetical protein